MFAGAEIEKSRQVAYKIIVVRREKKMFIGSTGEV